MNEHPRRNRRALLLLLVALPLAVVSFVSGSNPSKADNVCGYVNVFVWASTTSTSVQKDIAYRYCDSASHANCQPGAPAVSVTVGAPNTVFVRGFVCRQFEP